MDEEGNLCPISACGRISCVCVFVCVDIPERVHSLHQLIQRQMNDVRSLFYAHQTHAVVIDCLLLL